MNKDFVKQVLERVVQLTEEEKCVFILHQITKNTLNDMGVMEKLKNNGNFVFLHRVDYFDFMKLLNASKYVFADGGSNLEELRYKGKPCLIMRKTTERNEEIGKNAIMYQCDVDRILAFGKEFEIYKMQSLVAEESPSSIIANML